MTALIYLGQLLLHKAAHLKDAQHLLLLIIKGKVVGQELNLEGVRELLDEVVVEQVKKLREKSVLRLVNVNLVDLALLLLTFLCLLFL